MPLGTEEALHFHHQSQQFFYTLSGIATFEIEGKTAEIKANGGVHIKPNQKHKIKNDSNTEMHLLIISEPKSHEDRIDIEMEIDF